MSRSHNRRSGPPPQAQSQPTGVPQDRQAPRSPAQREAEVNAETLIPVTYRGVDLLVPPADEWHPITIKGPLAAGNIIGAVYRLLNPMQMNRLAQALPDFKDDDYYALFQEISKAAGFGNAGNS